MSWFSRLGRSTDPHKQHMAALTDQLRQQIEKIKTDDSDTARVALRAIKDLSEQASTALNLASKSLKPGKKLGKRATALFLAHQEAWPYLNSPKPEPLPESANRLRVVVEKYSQRDLLVLVPEFEAIAVNIEQDLQQVMVSFEKQKDWIVELSNQFMMAEEGRVDLERRLSEHFSVGSFRFNLDADYKRVEKKIFNEWDEVQELSKQREPEKAFQIKKKLVRELERLRIRYAQFKRILGNGSLAFISISRLYSLSNALKKIQTDYHKLSRDIESFSRLKSEYVQDMVQIAADLNQVDPLQRNFSKDEWQKFLEDKEEGISKKIYDVLSQDAPADVKTPSVSDIRKRLDEVGVPVDFAPNYAALKKRVSEYREIGAYLESFPILQSRVEKETKKYTAVLSEFKLRIAQ